MKFYSSIKRIEGAKGKVAEQEDPELTSSSGRAKAKLHTERLILRTT